MNSFLKISALVDDKNPKTTFLGGLKDKAVIDIYITAPRSATRIVGNSVKALRPNEQIMITKEIRTIKLPGENIFARIIENLGNGKLLLHTVGLVQTNYKWKLEQTAVEVQFYSFGEGELFTPFLLHQKDLLEVLKKTVKGEMGIPTYANDYREFVPEIDTVLWFDSFRLIGAIHTEHGDAMFHWNDIAEGHKSCAVPGAKVQYSGLSAQSGSFAWKARNISWAKAEA